MKRYLFILAAAIVITGCDQRKQAETSTKAGTEFVVDKLFTVDNCTVYRFLDGGRLRYFTNCKGTTEWTESCGKNCTNSVGIDGGGK